MYFQRTFGGTLHKIFTAVHWYLCARNYLVLKKTLFDRNQYVWYIRFLCPLTSRKVRVPLVNLKKTFAPNTVQHDFTLHSLNSLASCIRGSHHGMGCNQSKGRKKPFKQYYLLIVHKIKTKALLQHKEFHSGMVASAFNDVLCILYHVNLTSFVLLFLHFIPGRAPLLWFEPINSISFVI